MSKTKKIVLVIVSVIVVLLLCAGVYAYSLYSSTQGESLSDSQVSASTASDLSDDVTNIALFGIDNRSADDAGRSDTIIIASINKSNKSIRLSSVMRDTFAKVTSSDGTVSYQKINAAYALGGAASAVKALNENFDLNITKYATIDFDGLVEIINTLGGITLNIEDQSVLDNANETIQNEYNSSDLIPGTGEQVLDGLQTLAYARVRYADSDYGRTSRTRQILEAVLSKAKASGTMEALNMISTIAPYIDTSLSVSEMTDYAQTIMDSSYTVQEFSVPTKEYSLYGYDSQGQWCIYPNTLEDNAKLLHQTIYGQNVQYTPSSELQEISSQISNEAGQRSE